MPEKVLFGHEKMSEEMVEKRCDWRDTVLDCSRVMGSVECLQTLCVSLQGEIDRGGSPGCTMQWNKIESIFMCIQLISSGIPPDECTILPQLLALVLNFPAEIVELRVTVIYFIGKLARWLADNQTQLLPLLTLLFSSLQDATTCLSASKALMNILISCSSKVRLPIEELHSAMLKMRATSTLSLEADMFLLEGLGHAVSCLPQEAQGAAFEGIVEPIANDLMHSLHSPTANTFRNDASASMDRLTTIIRHVHISEHLMLNIFMKLFPLCQQILQFDSSDAMCEKVCRFYKYAIRSCKKSFAPHLQQMATYISEQFQRKPSSAFVYVASVCIADFGSRDNGSHIDYLYAMVWSISSSFFSKFNPLDKFVEEPDMVAEYFYMLSKALRICPSNFVQSQSHAMVIIEAGFLGLTLRNRESQKCTLLFFERLLEAPLTPGLDNTTSNLAADLVKNCASKLMHVIIAQLSGQTQTSAYAIDEKDGCICDVLWCIKKSYTQLFNAALVAEIQAFTGNAREQAQKLNLLPELLENIEKSNFFKLVDTFERKCGNVSSSSDN